VAETVHVDDQGTVIYVDVNDQGVSLGTLLDSYTGRVVKIKRPSDPTLITITGVPTEVDSEDNIKKLKLVLGTDTGTSLTGTGLFKVPSTELGEWIGQVTLSVGSNSWNSDSFKIFDLLGNLS
jgi:hypothetical protein